MKQPIYLTLPLILCIIYVEVDKTFYITNKQSHKVQYKYN